MSQLINAGFNHIVIYPQGNGGINMNLNIISNLANGSNSNDAVNLSQLQSVQSSIPTKLSDLSVLNTANINLNSNKIINVVDPVNAQDVSTKNYVDNKVSSVVVPTKLSDLSVLNTANLNLNSYKIINVVDPTNSQDGATKNYVDNKVSSLTSADLNLNTHKITNLVDPVNLQDGATKNYVDTKVATVSGGSTLTQTLTTTAYAGSLANVSVKVLWLTDSIFYIPNQIILNNLITNLGGVPLNINIIPILNIRTNTTLTYDSSYDVVIWAESVTTTYNNVITLLNTYYSNGKGVVISMFANSTNTSLTKNISNSSNQLTTFTATYVQTNTNHPIIYGCTTLVSPYYANQTFTSQNGSTIIGSFGGSTGVAAYLDDNVYGRRVDLNYVAGDYNYITSDTTNTGLQRLTLQALLWAGRKINSTYSSSFNFDVNNMQLVNNLNCNSKRITNCADPVNNSDVLTLNYYNKLRPSDTLNLNSNYVYLGYAFNNLKFFFTESATNTPSLGYEITILCNKVTSNPSYYVKGDRFDGYSYGTYYSYSGSYIGPFIIGDAQMIIRNGYLFLGNISFSYSLSYNVI